MIKNCNNCAGRLRYNISKKMLECDSCQSTFEISKKVIRKKEFIPTPNETSQDRMNAAQKSPFKPVSSKVDDDEPVREQIECNVYICNSCGSEISVNDTESSKTCVYCGNSNIIFSRILSMYEPEKIIPFEITKEEALDRVKAEVKKAFLLPKELKNISPDLIQGVYVPFYVSKVEVDAIYGRKTEENNKNYSDLPCTQIYGSIKNVTTDASVVLDDDTTANLNPYDLSKAVPFNSDYILGFCSDIADTQPRGGINAAKDMAEVITQDFFRKTPDFVYGKPKRFIAEIYENPYVAMLPVWFFTYRYNNRPYTLLVNGQTGKVTGNVPFNKTKLITIAAIIITLLTTLILLFNIVYTGVTPEMIRENDLLDAFLFVFFTTLFELGLAIFFLFRSRKQIKQFFDAYIRTTSKDLNDFAKNR